MFKLLSEWRTFRLQGLGMILIHHCGLLFSNYLELILKQEVDSVCDIIQALEEMFPYRLGVHFKQPLNLHTSVVKKRICLDDFSLAQPDSHMLANEIQ